MRSETALGRCATERQLSQLVRLEAVSQLSAPCQSFVPHSVNARFPPTPTLSVSRLAINADGEPVQFVDIGLDIAVG